MVEDRHPDSTPARQPDARRSPPDALDDLREALQLSEVLGDEGTAGVLRVELAEQYLQQEEPQEALACLLPGLEAVQAAGDADLEGVYQLTLGIAHHALGQLGEARTCLQRAGELGAARGNAGLEGSALGQLGLLLQEMGVTAAAVEALRRSRELCHKGGDEEREAVALCHLAHAYADLGEGERALDAAEVASELPSLAQRPRLWAGLHELRGRLYQERAAGSRAENLEQALAAYDRALAGAPAELEPVEWARIQQNRAVAYLSRLRGEPAQNVEAAIQALEGALRVLTREENLQSWARAQLALAEAWRKRREGDHAANVERALAGCQAVVEACDPGSDATLWAEAQINLGIAYRERMLGDRAENLERAITALGQVLARLDREADAREWAAAHSNLGICYHFRVRGDRPANQEAALHHLRAALEVYAREGWEDRWALVQMNLGVVYHHRQAGDRDDNQRRAIAALEAALPVCERMGHRERLSQVQTNLAAAYVALAEHGGDDAAELAERACACLEDALEKRPREAYPREAARLLSNLGAAYLLRDGRRGLARALPVLEQGVALAAQLGLDDELAKAAENLAGAREGEEAWAEAHAALGQAIGALERLESQQATDDARRHFLRRAAPLYVRDAFCLSVLEQPAAALERLERGRTRFLGEALARDDLRLAALAPEERQAFVELRDRLRALAVEQQAPAARPWVALAEEVRLAREEFQALLERLQQHAPELWWQGLAAPDIQALVDDDATALVTWAISPHGSITFLVTLSHGVEVQIEAGFTDDDLLPVLVEALDGEGRPVGGWMGGYDRTQIVEATEQRPAVRERDAWFASLERLEAPLIAPLRKRLQALGMSRLILMPVGGLHMLPLHAVGHPCLLEGHVVTYAPSAAILARCRARLREPEREAAEGALLAADSGGTLAFAGAEVRSLARLLEGVGQPVEALAEQDATEDAIEAAAPGRRWLHLACHGKYDWAHPSDSALWLGDAEGRLAPYLLWEIQAGLDLRAARLVTLSACETGLSDSFDLPEEVVGLPAGFLMAGAPAVVSSLWTVNDLSTMLLMQRFYAAHLGGTPLPEALRAAQRWLRTVTAGELAARFRAERAAPDGERSLPYAEASAAWGRFAALEPGARPFQHPYYWAAFTYNGA